MHLWSFPHFLWLLHPSRHISTELWIYSDKEAHCSDAYPSYISSLYCRYEQGLCLPCAPPPLLQHPTLDSQMVGWAMNSAQSLLSSEGLYRVSCHSIVLFFTRSKRFFFSYFLIQLFGS